MNHLRAVLGDAACLVFASHHEAGNVLQKYERNAALITELDEVSRFQCRLAEQHAVVGDDADGVSMNARETANQCCPISCFEFTKLAAINKPRNDLVNIISLAE